LDVATTTPFDFNASRGNRISVFYVVAETVIIPTDPADARWIRSLKSLSIPGEKLCEVTDKLPFSKPRWKVFPTFHKHPYRSDTLIHRTRKDDLTGDEYFFVEPKDGNELGSLSAERDWTPKAVIGGIEYRTFNQSPRLIGQRTRPQDV
jgi:hypothetical protein